MNTKETLMKRGNEYGEFSLQAEMSQSMESVLRSGPGWKKMNPAQKEAAKMIVHKLARLANGNPNSFDGWHDIQGYAKLAEDRCRLPPATDPDYGRAAQAVCVGAREADREQVHMSGAGQTFGRGEGGIDRTP